MGNRNAKIIPLPIPVVLKRINECHVPDDRNQLVDYFEMLDINMSEEKDFEVNTKQLKESNGISIMMRILKRMIQDVDLVFVSLQLMENVKFNTPIVMDIIQFGGLDFLEAANKVHADDEFIAGSIPKLLKILLAIGAPACIEEIKREAQNLQLCHKCQETIERLNQKHNGNAGPIVIPKSHERINRVVKFMDNFLAAAEVQVVALDAVIAFARNADAPRSTHETNLITVVHSSLKRHAADAKIMWRVCMAYSLVGAFSADIAFNIAKTGAHNMIIDHYAAYKKAHNHLVMQQVLWMFASLLSHTSSRLLINKQLQCMDFFKMVIQDFEDIKLQVANDPASKKKGFKDDKVYHVVVPLKIRSFIRETHGLLAKDIKRHEEKIKRKERRNFDERPKYGTVSTAIYVEGERGLISGDNEDDFGNEMRAVPDWEKKIDAMAK